ncbi:hypothetical protein QJS66_18875 [Kocuria rhizophila]|nr:hypothetical protein QJS66_18875 [Kocuria rhizophila]
MRALNGLRGSLPPSWRWADSPVAGAESGFVLALRIHRRWIANDIPPHFKDLADHEQRVAVLSAFDVMESPSSLSWLARLSHKHGAWRSGRATSSWRRRTPSAIAVLIRALADYAVTCRPPWSWPGVPGHRPGRRPVGSEGVSVLEGRRGPLLAAELVPETLVDTLAGAAATPGRGPGVRGDRRAPDRGARATAPSGSAVVSPTPGAQAHRHGHAGDDGGPARLEPGNRARLRCGVHARAVRCRPRAAGALVCLPAGRDGR